jgi:hypothetical protein
MLFHPCASWQWLPRGIMLSSSLLFKHFGNFEVEPNDIGHVDIFGDAQLLTYIQTRELDLGLTSKEKNQII